jgi:hypothetical protein
MPTRGFPPVIALITLAGVLVLRLASAAGAAPAVRDKKIFHQNERWFLAQGTCHGDARDAGDLGRPGAARPATGVLDRPTSPVP